MLYVLKVICCISVDEANLGNSEIIGKRESVFYAF